MIWKLIFVVTDYDHNDVDLEKKVMILKTHAIIMVLMIIMTLIIMIAAVD